MKSDIKPYTSSLAGRKYFFLNIVTLCIYHSKGLSMRASMVGVQEARTPTHFRYSLKCAVKFLNQFRRNALKTQFKKRKNP